MVAIVEVDHAVVATVAVVIGDEISETKIGKEIEITKEGKVGEVAKYRGVHLVIVEVGVLV